LPITGYFVGLLTSTEHWQLYRYDSVVALQTGFNLVEVCCCRWRYGSW